MKWHWWLVIGILFHSVSLESMINFHVHLFWCFESGDHWLSFSWAVGFCFLIRKKNMKEVSVQWASHNTNFLYRVLGDYWTRWITGAKLSSNLDNSVTRIRRLLRKAVREMSTRVGSDLIFFPEVRWCSLNKEQQAQYISSKIHLKCSVAETSRLVRPE
jgi:RNase P protein component